MSDEELVRRLRAVEIDDDHDLWTNSHLFAEAAEAIERLTQERDDAKADHVRRHHDAIKQQVRAEAAERKVEKLREALEDTDNVLRVCVYEVGLNEDADGFSMAHSFSQSVMDHNRAALAETEKSDD